MTEDFSSAVYKNNLIEIVKHGSFAFIDVVSLDDLFDDVFTSDVRWFHKLTNKANISGHCSAWRTRLQEFYCVTPSAKLIEYIEGNMIWTDYDTISFELIEREDGLLVIAKNNQILADRWLALVDPDGLSKLEGVRK